MQMKKLLIALTALMFAGMAAATLPPPSDEAKAKAAEAKNKTAWSAKVAAYKLCLVQNRVAENYLKSNGKPKPVIDVPPCQNPGPYVAMQDSAPATPANSKSVPQASAKKQATPAKSTQ
jgi:acyl-CoA synthetase (AMP-forming)/AMP-acid ligase II